ncbi:hypothetical protein [Massilia phosphatilytica]
MAGLDPWNELQDYPISKINFVANSVNLTVPNPGTTSTYATQLHARRPVAMTEDINNDKYDEDHHNTG